MKKEFEDEMKEELQEKYHESLDFWNSALKSDEAEFADVLMYYNDVLLCYGISEGELKEAYTFKFEKNIKRW